MTPEKKAALRKYGWIGLLIAVVVLVIAGFALPVFSRREPGSLLLSNLVRAERVMSALKFYASQHNNEFPQSLEALIRQYGAADDVLWAIGEGEVKVRWQYLPGQKYSEESETLVLSSPPDKDGCRVVGYSNAKAEIVHMPRTNAQK